MLRGIASIFDSARVPARCLLGDYGCVQGYTVDQRLGEGDRRDEYAHDGVYSCEHPEFVGSPSIIFGMIGIEEVYHPHYSDWDGTDSISLIRRYVRIAHSMFGVKASIDSSFFDRLVMCNLFNKYTGRKLTIDWVIMSMTPLKIQKADCYR